MFVQPNSFYKYVAYVKKRKQVLVLLLTSLKQKINFSLFFEQVFVKITLALLSFCFFITADADIDPWYEENPSCVIDRGNAARTGEYKVVPLKSFHGVKWSNHTDRSDILLCYKHHLIPNKNVFSRMEFVDSSNGKISDKYLEAIYQNKAVYKDILYTMNKSMLLTEYSFKSKRGFYQKFPKFSSGYSTCCSLLFYNGVVYMGETNLIRAYQLNGMKLLWEFPIPSADRRITEFSTDGDKLYFSGDRYIYALDMKNGKLAWKCPGNTATYISLHKKKAIVVGKTAVGKWQDYPSVYVIDTKNGKLLWKYSLKYGYQVFSLAVSQNKVFVIEHSNAKNRKTNLHCFDINSGRLLWKTPIDSAYTLLIAGNFIYTVDANNVAFIVDAQTGKILSKYNIPIGSISNKIYKIFPIMLVNKGLLIMDNNGNLTFME